MKTNAELQADVQNALKWEPLLKAAEIGVIVHEGIVTLTGEVDSYAKKMHAEKAAKKVIGVKAMIEKIEVKFPNAWSKTNNEIATEVVNALHANTSFPDDRVTVKVEDGWITLEGELPWNYQKEAAKACVNYLVGVKGVTNNITIKTETHDTIEKKEIEKALARSLSVNDNDIKVHVSGTKVTLTGTVNSWYQKEEAERIAWKTPGVWKVENELAVDYYYDLVG